MSQDSKGRVARPDQEGGAIAQPDEDTQGYGRRSAGPVSVNNEPTADQEDDTEGHRHAPS